MDWGDLWGNEWSGGDVPYGDNPIEPGAMWDDTFRPPLIDDPEWLIWKAVISGMMEELLGSQWLTRWRRSVATATGAQLDARGTELNYPRPVGWSHARYQAVLVALMPASFGHPTTDVVYSLSTALLDDGQSVTFAEEWPATGRFTFLETDADDGIAYASALNRARASGHNYWVVVHPGGDEAPFTIGMSEIGGNDTLAELIADTEEFLDS